MFKLRSHKTLSGSNLVVPGANNSKPKTLNLKKKMRAMLAMQHNTERATVRKITQKYESDGQRG